MKLRHLNKSGKHPTGNDRWYFRPKGRKGIALPDLPMDHPRFLTAYVAAAEAHGLTDLKPRKPVLSGSIAAELALYLQSDDWLLGLKPSTRSRRRTFLDEVADRYGHAPVAGLRVHMVQIDLDRFSGHPRNNRLRAWRGFGMWLKSARRLPHDPTLGLVRAKVAKSDGHIPWSAEDVEAFRAFWPLGTAERLALELIFWTGARMSDAIRLGEGNVDREGWLAFTQAKTGGVVHIPFKRELPEFAECYAPDLELLHRAIGARNERHLTFMVTEHGAARSPKSASQWFAAAARKAGLVARTAHGLRKSRAIALVEAGGGSPQVAAWTGHESLREVERYIRQFNRKKALTRADSGAKVPTPVIQFQNRCKKDAASNG